jgi:hypothetical protein
MDVSNFGGRPTRAFTTDKSLTLAASGETANVTLFTVTGAVLIHGIWGVVTTVIGANHTHGFLQLADGTATPDLTEAGTGITLSALKAGTLFYKESLAAVALKLVDNAAAAVEEPAAAGTTAMSPFVVVKKTAATTTINYSYQTTDEPTSGVIQFFVSWEPLSADGNLAAT